jgi:hypothetical protein
VKDVNDFISPGQKIKTGLLKIQGDNKISLSIKAANPGEPPFVPFLVSTLLEIPACQLSVCEACLFDSACVEHCCAAESDAERAQRQGKEREGGGKQRAPARPPLGSSTAQPEGVLLCLTFRLLPNHDLPCWWK